MDHVNRVNLAPSIESLTVFRQPRGARLAPLSCGMTDRRAFSGGAGAKNQLLASLPHEEFERLKSRLTTVPLSTRQVLHKEGERVRHVYFPNSGVISMTTVLSDGSVVEAATVGDDGLVGIDAFYRDDVVSSCETIVQVPLPHESAEMMAVADFRREIANNSAFREAIAGYALMLQARIIRLTACNARHSINERCARWLLTAHNHMHGHDFHLSQEFLAVMLGVRRQSVSAVANSFQSAGLIRYSHGNMSIVDRRGLERASCECYAVLRQLSVEPT